MLIKDVMKRNVITVKRSTSLRDLILRLRDFHTFPLIPVVDHDGHLMGTFSFKNLIEIFLPYEVGILKAIPFFEREEINIFDLEITPELTTLLLMDDVMETKFRAVHEDDRIEEVYKEMKADSIDMLPVINNEKRLVGMIGIFDIIVALFRAKGVIGN